MDLLARVWLAQEPQWPLENFPLRPAACSRPAASWITIMRPSYIKVGGSYRPCIRDDAGRVVWQADDVLCTNRDHSTSRGPSAMDLARFALDAANDPAKFESLILREPPEVVRRSIWGMETHRAKQQQYRWAIAVAEQVQAALAGRLSGRE